MQSGVEARTRQPATTLRARLGRVEAAAHLPSRTPPARPPTWLLSTMARMRSGPSHFLISPAQLLVSDAGATTTALRTTAWPWLAGGGGVMRVRTS
jgi:hypothetical protein